MEKANNCCESCGKYVIIYQYNIDHIFEHRYGGTNDIENGQLLCHECHCIKATWNKRNLKI